MNRYHLLYKEKPKDTHTKGKNIEADTMELALKDFNKQHKGIEPTYIENKGTVKGLEFDMIVSSKAD